MPTRGHAGGVGVGDVRRVGRVVSGGQAGADRAALDAAMALGMPYGGWCPVGGWAEDLEEAPGLLARYPALREAPPGPVSTRTSWNVRDSDATLVLALGDPARSRGTSLTLREATRQGRPLLAAHAGDVVVVGRWLSGLPAGCVLNVAGPRESEEPGLYAVAHRTLLKVLER
jgi:hypothetical protein